MLLNVTEPLREPIDRWVTREEMIRIGTDVLAYEQRTGQIPDRRGWLDWLEWRYQVDESTKDPWDTTYELKVWPDSVGILSYGPDRTRATEDDFTVVLPRRGTRRR
jgi:hypothetical protein